MTITSGRRYLEDYSVGDTVVHRRGHTVTSGDNAGLSLLTMNTAQTHFNADSMRTYLDGAFSAPLLNACVALALAVGLTTEDMSENALRDLGYTEFRMPAPIFVGDTLYSRSEVLAVDAATGVLTYRITTTKADGTDVLRVVRRVLLKRRDVWAARDADFSTAQAAAGRAALAR